ncbi:MAG: hypothetical protein AAFW97_14485 [Pseudomonadota bacterium]
MAGFLFTALGAGKSLLRFLLETTIGNIILISIACFLLIWKLTADARAEGYASGVEDMVAVNEEAREEWDARIETLETVMTDGIASITANVREEIDEIEIVNRTQILPSIEREIANDPAFNNPECVISDELRNLLNGSTSPEPSGSPGADGGVSFALPRSSASG